MSCRWPLIPTTQELRDLAKLVTAVELLRAGFGRRLEEWLADAPVNETPDLGTFLYAVVMAEDQIQMRRIKSIEGLVYGYMYENEEWDPAARVALSAVVRGDEPALGVRISFEWHDEIAACREELDDLAVRLYDAMIRIAPAAVVHTGSTHCRSSFEYFRASTNAFGNFSETMAQFGAMLTQTSTDYIYESQAITFLDNHDVTRFRYIQPNDKPFHAAIATLMTARGTPNIYYGTEQYMSSANSSDIAGRGFMQVAAPAFSQTTAAYTTIKKLAALRASNDALAYGETSILYSNNDVLVFSRKFYDKQVVVAVNRQPAVSYTVPALVTSLPAGTYTDQLTGTLLGASNTVASGQLASFTLSGGEVDVWSYNPSLGTTIPRIGDVVSTAGRAGNRVYIYGTGLGGTPTVKFGTTTATVVSAGDTAIEATVPAAPPGILNITVAKGANTSNTFRYEVLSDDQVQVNFKVNASTVVGQNVYVVGSIPELGSWDPAKASEAMMNPNYPVWFLPVSVPKNTTFQFKFIKKDGAGNVIWEGGSNRSFTSPSSSTGTVDTAVLSWQ